MIKTVIVGAAGRMGRCLVSAVSADPDFELAGAVEAEGHPDLGKDAGAIAGMGTSGVEITLDLEPLLNNADVVIEFSSPSSTVIHADIAAGKKKAVVIGTTGLSDEEYGKIKSLASVAPILFAPNMSTGVNLMFHLAGKTAEMLGKDFDIEISETHHRLKKDAPSGTALRLGEVLARARGLDFPGDVRFHREGIIGERKRDEIGIQSLRAGDIVGEHTVLFAGPGERIEITHRAHSRDTFVHGALRAAKWLVGRKPGLYSMQDVLGIK